ncbi:MAG TPA: response regulator transcription factor [Terriglobales bacterium]|jgi:DNA-binding NarL/FixJ family response regulator|nr:response regulator transcription factor [Terriglobales bacterium]HKR29253.1 response regulator transcription factor [Terriglobales bacterium]
MLKIILADSQAIFRAGAAKVLAVEDDFRIVAQCENTDRMMVALESFRANVLIFSTAMRVDIRQLVEAAKKIKTRLIIVIESADNSAQYLQLGISGVVFRNVSGASLVECVRKVSRGETWVQDAGAAAEATENDIVGARVRDRLTPKELRIVALIVQGFKNKEIATQLGTTEQVIKNYLRNVYDKIGVSDRLELALFTIHHRILNEAAAALVGSATNQMSN